MELNRRVSPEEERPRSSKMVTLGLDEVTPSILRREETSCFLRDLVSTYQREAAISSKHTVHKIRGGLVSPSSLFVWCVKTEGRLAATKL
jgi:hypothetical protein